MENNHQNFRFYILFIVYLFKSGFSQKENEYDVINLSICRPGDTKCPHMLILLHGFYIYELVLTWIFQQQICFPLCGYIYCENLLVFWFNCNPEPYES